MKYIIPGSTNQIDCKDYLPGTVKAKFVNRTRDQRLWKRVETFCKFRSKDNSLSILSSAAIYLTCVSFQDRRVTLEGRGRLEDGAVMVSMGGRERLETKGQGEEQVNKGQGEEQVNKGQGEEQVNKGQGEE